MNRGHNFEMSKCSSISTCICLYFLLKIIWSIQCWYILIEYWTNKDKWYMYICLSQMHVFFNRLCHAACQIIIIMSTCNKFKSSWKIKRIDKIIVNWIFLQNINIDLCDSWNTRCNYFMLNVYVQLTYIFIPSYLSRLMWT